MSDAKLQVSEAKHDSPSSSEASYKANLSNHVTDANSGNEDYDLPPGQGTPDLVHPESLEEIVPLIEESMVTSTPFPHKYIVGLKSPSDDPFQTPSNTDSSERSLTTPSTNTQASNSSMEIFLGPQPVPFIRNRHRLLLGNYESPSRLSNKHLGLSQLKPATITRQPQPLSKWRQEQLKKAKGICAVAGTRVQPIPLLHGPLSLPYARNPSGVDATVADNSNYLSNVFGVRMASPEKDGRRTVSDSTDTRTVSSSSYKTANSTMSTRPSLVRDYNQIIGIKNDGRPSHETNDKLANLRGLGLGKPTAPTLHDDCIHSASVAPWRSEVETLQTEFKTLTLVDPITNSIYTVRVPRAESGERVPSAEFIAQQSSKADASINWRSKVVAHKDGRLVPATPPAPANTPLRPTQGEHNVLTVENLCEKFGTTKNVAFARQVTVKTHKSTNDQALGESTGRQVNTGATSDKDKKKKRGTRKDGTRKGTPGAGKHLKRSETAEEGEEKAGTARKVRSAAPSPVQKVAKPARA